MGIVGTHLGSFRKSGKQRSCGIRNLEEDTEDGRQARMLEGKCRRAYRRDTECAERNISGWIARVSSTSHESCYHKLHYLSNTIIVLEFSNLHHLFERFCKKKKIKG